MESPVRTVDTSAGSAKSGTKQESSSVSSRFEAKSYLERQVEELSCADEEEAQQKVSKRLELKQERAREKRDIQLQRRRKGIAERLCKIREAREAADARFAENAALLMERQAEKQTSATRRRRISLENIKKARATHNRRVNQRRRESFDGPGELAPGRSKGMDDYESKLARAERNRENLRCERRRRTMERYKEGRERAFQQGLLEPGSVVGGSSIARGGAGGAGVSFAREHRRRRVMEARQEAKARQRQRMRCLREHMLSRATRVSERKTRVYAARMLQTWWRCVRAGKVFHVSDVSISSAEDPPDCPSLASPACWAASRGINISLKDGVCGPLEVDTAPPGPKSPLDPCTKSPLPTFRKFSAGVGERRLGAREKVRGDADEDEAGRGSLCLAGGDGSDPNHKAAVAIQAFLRRNMHPLKVARALLAGRLSFKVLCAAVQTLSTSTFDESIDLMSTRAIVGHCETALKALRMGREMRSVPHNVRSARAFLSALLVNFFPTSALDDEGALSSSPEGTAPLQLEKDRLVRAAGNAVGALVCLERTIDAAFVAIGGDEVFNTSPVAVEHFRRIRKASGTMVRARVAFCRRFAEWKRKDAVRLADEMTVASVDILLMQMRTDRDLVKASVVYRFDEQDDNGDVFSTGYDQLKRGTQRQLGKMIHALSKLVGADDARRRMHDAAEAAFQRLQADELVRDANYENHVRESLAKFDIPMDAIDRSLGLGQRSQTAESTGGTDEMEGGSATATAGSGSVCGTEAAAALLAGKAPAEEEEDIAGPRRPLCARDLLSNEWLVHEVMISDEPLSVSLEEAIENQLLRSGNPAWADGSEDAAEEYWRTVERNVAVEDYTPLLALVAELRDKIIGLTPRRRDLAVETCEAMDVELLQQMMTYGAFDVGSFFRMVAFAGERVLELEAPIRNEGTKATLAGWGRTQDDVEEGRRRLEPAMVRECFEYLFSKTDEIHVDILNAHLQFVTPFLKQHGVEYERDRFTEKLDAGDTSLEVTHRWLHRTILQLRSAAEGNTPSTLLPVSQTPGASAEMLLYRQLLTDLEQRKGDAYLKLLRVAIVDNLLASIVKVDRKLGSSGASGVKSGSYEAQGKGASATVPAGTGESGGGGGGGGMRDDQQEDMLEGVAIPETLGLDQYRLVVIAAGAEQASYSASLVAFARQALAGARVPLNRADEDRMREALMVLFETEDVTSADICAQVAEMTRQIAVASEKVLMTSQLSILTARARNVLTTGDCPVYKLFLRRTLAILRDTLVEGGVPEDRFTTALRKAGLADYKTFLLERVVRPLIVIQRHNEAVFATFYNEIIPYALATTDPAAAGAHAQTLDVD